MAPVQILNIPANRLIAAPFLGLNLVLYLVVLAAAAWSLDTHITPNTHRRNPGTEVVTECFLIFSLLAGITGVCSIIVGAMHLLSYWSGTDSLPVASAVGLLSWATNVLAFGFACKEMQTLNRQNSLKTLEAFIIILTLTQFMYLGGMHVGAVSGGGRSSAYEGQVEDPHKPMATTMTMTSPPGV